MPRPAAKVGAAARVTWPKGTTVFPIMRKGDVTFEKFCAIITEDQKADLIDGVIFMASPENTEANALFVWLLRLLGDYIEERELGQVFGQKVALRLEERNGPETDLCFVKAEHADRVERGHILGPADFAIEIVTPESADRDYVRKRRQYEQFGISEYWIIDEEVQAVTALRLNARGKYREVRPVKGVLHCEAIADFWLRLEWLWQNPRPKVREILHQIIGS